MADADTRREVVLVSGGSRGLGLEIARSLLGDGHRVAAFSRHATSETAALEAAHGDRFMFAAGDVADADGLAPLVGAVEAKLGPITVLVNNAGIVNEAFLARQEPAAIDRLIDVNLRGALLLTRQVLRGMMVRRHGRIINISSIVAVRGFKGTVAYSATKGAIDAMTRALAREVGGRDITVNSIAPGYMETALTVDMDPQQLKQIVRRTPLGRAGRVEDVTGVVAFLISPAAGFVSGQTIVVDGGLTA